MGGRTPSFLVVGLVLITFLIGFFYMSCSTKTSELQRMLNDFEGRIRVLTVKTSDKERELETVVNQKRDLEQEKNNIRKQIEKKDSEINELNTKLNERLAELRNLKSDKQTLDERLREYKNASDMLASKNFAIGKLQQEYDERKRSDGERLLQLQQEFDRFRNNRSNQSREGPVDFGNQRFRPLLPTDERSQNTSSLLQEPLAKLGNITNQIKEQIAPVARDIKQRISNVLNLNHNPNVGQNLPAPPLDIDRRRVEVQESGREIDNINPIPDKDEARERRQRSLDNPNKPVRDVRYNEAADNAGNNSNGSLRVRPNDANVANHLEGGVARLPAESKNYHVANREESQKEPLNKNDRSQAIANNRKQEGGRGNLL